MAAQVTAPQLTDLVHDPVMVFCLGGGGPYRHFFPDQLLVAHYTGSTPGSLGGLWYLFPQIWTSTPSRNPAHSDWSGAFCRRFHPPSDLGTKKFDRYLLPMYLPLDLVAATGWVALAGWLTTRRPGFIRRYGALLLLAAALPLQTVGTLHTFPYYLSYQNPLLGGSRKAPEVMQIGWGEGLDQAGHYLDEMAQGRVLRVAAWYDRAFSPFFSGATRSIPVLPEFSETLMQQVLRSDYAVIYHHQWQRHIPKQLLETLA